MIMNLLVPHAWNRATVLLRNPLHLTSPVPGKPGAEGPFVPSGTKKVLPGLLSL